MYSPSKELFLGSEIGTVNKSAARLLHTKWRIIPASQEKLFWWPLYVYARMPPILICLVLSPPQRTAFGMSNTGVRLGEGFCNLKWFSHSFWRGVICSEFREMSRNESGFPSRMLTMTGADSLVMSRDLARWRAEVLALKHESNILRHSSNPVCGFSMGGTG